MGFIQMVADFFKDGLGIRAEDIPANLRDPDNLLDLIVKTRTRAFKITQASQGDDMTTGETRFITVYAQPYGRSTL